MDPVSLDPLLSDFLGVEVATVPGYRDMLKLKCVCLQKYSQNKTMRCRGSIPHDPAKGQICLSLYIEGNNEAVPPRM